MFEVVVRLALLALLTEQFEADDAVLLLRLRLRRLDPECDSTFHRRPRVAARHVLATVDNGQSNSTKGRIAVAQIAQTFTTCPAVR